MKSTAFIVLITTLLILSGCSISPDSSILSGSNNTINTGIMITGDIQEPLTDNISGINGEYSLFFDDDNISKTFTIHHRSDQHDVVSFINDGYKSLSVNIDLPTNDTGANLRLTQIIIPDGSQDGPFGSETLYSLTQNGGYQLIFHENMMAGDPWSGDAQVTISVNK